MLSKLQISAIRAREVLDCRGLPTVQVDVVVDDTFLGRADVPAGRSRGRHEPVELRDGGRRFGGYGVRQAVSNVRDVLAPALAGFPVVPQRQLDLRLVELDGTADRSRLGANALLGVSLAAARAAAAAAGQPRATSTIRTRASTSWPPSRAPRRRCWPCTRASPGTGASCRSRTRSTRTTSRPSRS